MLHRGLVGARGIVESAWRVRIEVIAIVNLFLQNREIYAERTAAPLCAFHLDPTTMQRNDLAHDKQPQTHPGNAVGGDVFSAVKLVEQVRYRLFWNSNTFIRDGDTHFALRMLNF